MTHNKNICSCCIDEEYLKNEVSTNGKKAKCSYCNQFEYCYSITEMSKVIERVFEEHFVVTDVDPNYFQTAMLKDKESDYWWEREGEPVIYAIMNTAKIPENAAEDIQELLNEKNYDQDAAQLGEEWEFCDETHYEDSDVNTDKLNAQWNKFKSSLKTENRFFNGYALEFLDAIFEHFDSLRTIDNRPLIVDAGPKAGISEVYRARCFQSDEKLEQALSYPEIELSPPPSDIVGAGRMNSVGISVFYGASNKDIALAEVRPPVGSKVVTGRFEIIQELKLLDLTALKSVLPKGSFFDPTFSEHLEKVKFLKGFCERISAPVLPDHEKHEYLPTQVIADYLASMTNLKVDGILFPSIQSAREGFNLVLFNKSSRVEKVMRKAGTTIHVESYAYYAEGPEIEYRVIEKASELDNSIVSTDNRQKESDSRRSTLKIDIDSLEVHIIEAADFKASDYKVERQEENLNDDFDEDF